MPLPAPDAGATVVVTGASSGIGEQLARQLSARGHHVTLVARRRSELERVAAGLPGDAAVLALDLGLQAGRDDLLAALDAGDRVVAGLCNSAGRGMFGGVLDLDPAEASAMVQLNVAALHDLTLAVARGMVERGRGAILNVGSVVGNQPVPRFASYAATKAFVRALSEAMHVELAPHGVSVTTVAPGPVTTAFAAAAGFRSFEETLPGPLRSTAEQVAREAIRGMERGDRVVTPGPAIRVAAVGGRVAPRGALLLVLDQVLRRARL